MAKTTKEPGDSTTQPTQPLQEKKQPAPGTVPAPDLSSSHPEVDNLLFEDEKTLIQEVVLAIRTIQFGSILLTVHDGQLVEISKNVRIRKGRFR
ncbi:MAG TPA: YezD family protein [Terriglobales bacterium]|nr:YezD family protein [Terriglobales bacterium]